MKEKTPEEVQKEIEGKVANLKEKQEAHQEAKKEKEKTLWEKLIAPFPEEAVQRAKKADTKKGYDTSGIGYQWVCNRLNSVLGIENWGYNYKILREKEGAYRNGTPYFDITVETYVWVKLNTEVFGAPHVGGHIAVLHADALKGAITNALKKTIATRFGVGGEAWMGKIGDEKLVDDDAKLPAEHEEIVKGKPEAILIDKKERKDLFDMLKKGTDDAVYEDRVKKLKEYLEATYKTSESGKLRKEWLPEIMKYVAILAKPAKV